MNDEAALRALADLAGIESEYVDIWGNHHPTSDRTRRALLQAMRVDVEQPQRSLQTLAERDWVNALRL